MTVAELVSPGVDAPAGARADVGLRPAGIADTDAIFTLIAAHIETGRLLPRSRSEIAGHVSRFLVAETPGGLVGCVELAPLGVRLAEARSLVVASSHRGRGVGDALLMRTIETAGRRGYRRLCAFTHAPRPFVRRGFSLVPHLWVPDKIATDCQQCPRFRRCGQTAVVLDLPRVDAARPGASR